MSALLPIIVSAAAADAAPTAVPMRLVDAAAQRCGISGMHFARIGRRAFSAGYDKFKTAVSFEDGPISPARERQMQAEAEAAMRPWNCLQRWARHRRVTITWEMPPHIIYD